MKAAGYSCLPLGKPEFVSRSNPAGRRDPMSTALGIHFLGADPAEQTMPSL